jgi:acetyltransferase-like isoleucine patch superfamily enzyme
MPTIQFIKKRLFRMSLPLLRVLGSIFFNKCYLKGKYFDTSLIGWKWVFRSIFWQKILGINRHVPWPVSPFILVSSPPNIEFDNNDLNNFQTVGNYFQTYRGTIHIGKGTCIGPNVGIITVNHDPKDLSEYLEDRDVFLGERCWIGMNSMILPGVQLGDCTIVGAGSVVTKSFPVGHVTIAGNPAKITKNSEAPFNSTSADNEK